MNHKLKSKDFYEDELLDIIAEQLSLSFLKYSKGFNESLSELHALAFADLLYIMEEVEWSLKNNKLFQRVLDKALEEIREDADLFDPAGDVT